MPRNIFETKWKKKVLRVEFAQNLKISCDVKSKVTSRKTILWIKLVLPLHDLLKRVGQLVLGIDKSVLESLRFLSNKLKWNSRWNSHSNFDLKCNTSWNFWDLGIFWHDIQRKCYELGCWKKNVQCRKSFCELKFWILSRTNIALWAFWALLSDVNCSWDSRKSSSSSCRRSATNFSMRLRVSFISRVTDFSSASVLENTIIKMENNL